MSIAGDWWNEFGSRVTIELDTNDPRQITGTYRTNVGRAQQRVYPLVGRCDSANLDDQVVSWVVVWDPPDPPVPGESAQKPSATAWVGQYHVVRGVEFLTTSWLLTRMTAARDDWEATRVNTDVFFRQAPTAEMIRAAEEFGKAAGYFSEEIHLPSAGGREDTQNE
jgi:avidin family protein